MGNRPDCAYFLLLGLCGAAFLLTIGGILTYVAFNPGAIEGHPHQAMSHIPHFHHHHQNPHHINHHPNHINENHHVPNYPHHTSTSTSASISTSQPQTHHNSTASASNSILKEESQGESVRSNSTNSSGENHLPGSNPNSHLHQPIHHNSPNPAHNLSSSLSPYHNQAAYESKAKQSLVLAIIGPLCLLMGIFVTLIVGVLALKYDCDHEPEPNIAFLRLRSEMSLNYDPDKNNYELLMPSSSIEQAGGQFSINPTGIHEST